jgi:hypothetical protein
MSLLTELGKFIGAIFYKYVAPTVLKGKNRSSLASPIGLNCRFLPIAKPKKPLANRHFAQQIEF